MREIILPHSREYEERDHSCAYPVEGREGQRICGAPCQTSSSYCSDHHSICYLAGGSKAERRQLHEVEMLASAVGGRRAKQGVAPSRQFLERLEQALRDF